ncbi:MAG: hypothetical protein JWM54_439 [Acidobacteriaceae bacterium]|nr:hypothetical protein [Acidobacteriaceae bacterium]
MQRDAYSVLELIEKPSPCQSLIYNVFQRDGLQRSQGGLVIALVAAHPGAGTSHITSQLVADLNRDVSGSAQSFSVSQLVNGILPGHGGAASGEGKIAGRGQITKREGIWRNDRTHRLAVLQSLRQQARYILLDCPSLRKSNESTALAPLVDGVLLVIEANRTTKDQVSYLERNVVDAGGRVLGHVLNKRTYPIPESVFSRLEKWGL